MSRLVRLYPQAWRDRYEEEFLTLLEERPPTVRDVADTIRGAVDAHLHPQLAGGDVEASPRTHRIPGLLALTAGLMWSGTFVFLAGWGERGQDWGNLPSWAMLLMFLSLPGDYMAAHGRRIAVAIAVLGGCIIGANILQWELGAVVAVIGGDLALAGMLTLAAIRAGIGRRGRWLLLAVAIAVPVSIGAPVAAGLVAMAPPSWLLLGIFLPYGVAWVVVGLRMAIRGSATFVDPPTSPLEAKVGPA